MRATQRALAADPMLSRVLQAWPHLSDEVQACIMAIVASGWAANGSGSAQPSGSGRSGAGAPTTRDDPRSPHLDSDSTGGTARGTRRNCDADAGRADSGEVAS